MTIQTDSVTLADAATTPAAPPVPPPEPAALRDGPLRPKTHTLTKVSIVIPVYNEEATIQHLVGLVVKAPLPDGLRARDHLRQRLLEGRHRREARRAAQTLFPGVDVPRSSTSR